MRREEAVAPAGWRVARLSTLLTRVTDRVQVDPKGVYRVCGVKWYGEGVFERETVLGEEQSAGHLSELKSGRLVYNRLFAWKASFAIVPPSCDGLFVSNEFPQFEIDATQVLPDYLLKYCVSELFAAEVGKVSEGSTAVSRNRLKEGSFLELNILLPPLDVQLQVSNAWATAMAEVSAAQAQAQRLEGDARQAFALALGLGGEAKAQGRRALALRWAGLETWGVESNRRLLAAGLASSLVPSVEARRCVAEVIHGSSASPANEATGLEVLKISAATKGWLDLNERKHTPNMPALRQRYALRKGDVLLCRTNGTLAYVGRAALVERDCQDLIFPDKLIRVRLQRNVLPVFFWMVLATPGLRAQIESRARTAVGNYAIGGKDVWELQLPLPTLWQQRQLLKPLRAAMRSSKALREQAQKASALAKQALESALLGRSTFEFE